MAEVDMPVNPTFTPAMTKKTTDRPSPRESHALGELLGIARVVRERVRSELVARGHELHPTQIVILPIVAAQDLRPTQLAEQLGLSVQRIVQVVGSLEEMGYVVTSVDPQDGRARIVRLAERGRQMARDFSDLEDAVWAELQDVVGEAGMKALARAVHRVHTAIDTRGSPLLRTLLTEEQETFARPARSRRAG